MAGFRTVGYARRSRVCIAGRELDGEQGRTTRRGGELEKRRARVTEKTKTSGQNAGRGGEEGGSGGVARIGRTGGEMRRILGMLVGDERQTLRARVRERVGSVV
jgi:hypothetical protein